MAWLISILNGINFYKLIWKTVYDVWIMNKLSQMIIFGIHQLFVGVIRKSYVEKNTFEKNWLMADFSV